MCDGRRFCSATVPCRSGGNTTILPFSLFRSRGFATACVEEFPGHSPRRMLHRY